MNKVAEQGYYKVLRESNGLEIKTVVQRRKLVLYRDRLETRYRRFALQEVHDISYRRIGGQEGMLYLHTSMGLYPYTVDEDPQPFIDAFKGLCGKAGKPDK
ncbi:hypothetical protein J31TS4_11300 [Paenibacillus sp. J31TS4]|uniref:hypothetical protein n=1 Tax=Paenibacillus sp. J31TS4 TaxID=2807195 RepID=UPI001B112F5A|nr:hypothetical protein [Paenibacillus sp. J31TS4]GIP37850.1 hypothetical protein J31TS4_11300 [Paenibacillus sp. J31TS4]